MPAFSLSQQRRSGARRQAKPRLWRAHSFALCLLAAVAWQPARTNANELVTLNAGINDAWFNPATSGQGFLITVLPDQGQVFLAWFTYDAERPAPDATAIVGEPGHRWLTAQGPIDGNAATLTVYVTSGGVFDAISPAASTDPGGDGTITIEFPDCSQGLVRYDIESAGLSGEIPIQRLTPDNIALCETLAGADPMACRPPPDTSHGPDNPEVVRGTIIDRFSLADGGPGPDGIPPLELPAFHADTSPGSIEASELVVGVKVGDDVRAYPHAILNWHEVVNDRFTVNGFPERATLSYCPLTGSAVLWDSFGLDEDETFGTSGALYNSNLVLYDRATSSYWAQMMEQAILGERVTWIPDRLQVVETTWGTWREMYPQTRLLSRDTGFSRDYDDYPYGSFREDNSLLFDVNNANDNRLHRKERVLGINVGDASKVYPVSGFSNAVEVLNDTVGDMSVVVAGSSGSNFAVVYNRQLEDCTVLEFQAVQGELPVVMEDNEGNRWDIFGQAVSGPRTGWRLQKTNSYIAYWYAWTAFFPNNSIHE